MRSQQEGEWALISCSSPEARCTAVFECLRKLNITGPQLIFEIEDPLSISTQEIETKTLENRTAIEDLGFVDQSFVRIKLMETFQGYERALREFLNAVGSRNLIIDITSLPKKVYFFLTKLLFQEFHQPENVVFTYAEPERYSDQPLAANPDPWEALPGFRVSPRYENGRSVVVGIGYEPLGLPDLVDSGKYDEAQMTFLFPFPAQADRVVRNWRFIRGIFPNADSNRLSIKRVDGINVPEVYQAISGIGEAGQHGMTLAPFGPKPVSLAMALYAARNSHAPTQTGVYYTQPTYYNPNYSYGIKQIDGEATLNAYCVKLNSHMLY
ncbi:hypothetical protein RA27_17360 [Ruegeria sp. ANG-R]|uniref:hypothetical protein n=1 Tax=Ruegeria sp. ANG-R TaxID=1577903 RepID=UPI00057CB901|nr:hypothetical protein [Ruegeria sp. ANG-R]KIC39818.1 hypothetical protein RA27_17360 [Ruegeria sp. ANG-R]